MQSVTCDCCVVPCGCSSEGPQNRAGASVLAGADHPDQRRQPVRRGPVHLLALHHACQDHQGLPHRPRWCRGICSRMRAYLSRQPFKTHCCALGGKMTVIEVPPKLQEFRHGQKSQASPSPPPRGTPSRWPAWRQAANQLPGSSGSGMTRKSKVSVCTGGAASSGRWMSRHSAAAFLLFVFPGACWGHSLAGFQPVLEICCYACIRTWTQQPCPLWDHCNAVHFYCMALCFHRLLDQISECQLKHFRFFSEQQLFALNRRV